MARPRKQGLLTQRTSEFGTILRDFRKASGFSQAELAERAGISTGYVGMLETGSRGERPSLIVVEKLAEALRLSPAQAATLAAAGGIDLNLKAGTDNVPTRHPRPAFEVFVDGAPELERSEKRLINMLYKQLTENRKVCL